MGMSSTLKYLVSVHLRGAQCHQQLATCSTAAGLASLSRPETVQSLFFLRQVTRDPQYQDLRSSTKWNLAPISTCACLLRAPCTAYSNSQWSIFNHVLCCTLQHFLLFLTAHKSDGDRSSTFCSVPASDCNESKACWLHKLCFELLQSLCNKQAACLDVTILRCTLLCVTSWVLHKKRSQHWPFQACRLWLAAQQQSLALPVKGQVTHSQALQL